jgi:DNA replication protein DnaC
MLCAYCNDSGVREFEGIVAKCGCALKREREAEYAREQELRRLDFDALSENIRRAAEERERHKAECTSRPCSLCERYLCKCGRPYDGDYRFCEMCRHEARVGHAIMQVGATIPLRFKWAVAADMALLQSRVKLAPERIAKALAEPPDGDLVLVGNTGTGKTSLAVAMLACAVRARPELRSKDRFASTYALAGARARHPLGQGEAPDVEKAMSAPLLLLDDVGSEADDRRNVISDIVFARHEADLPTWVTTGFTPEQLMARYGSALIRRLIEVRKPVELGK